MRHLVLPILFAAVLSPRAFAQATLPYSETFNQGVPDGWVLKASSGTVGWNVDAEPAVVAPGFKEPTFGGSAGSLNYNDDVDYYDGTWNNGTATSPTISTAEAAGWIKVFFRCNHHTAFQNSSLDPRKLEVLDGSNNSVLASYLFGMDGGSDAPATKCELMGEWHFHIVGLRIGDASSIRLRFSFEALGEQAAGYSGWFIDDVGVSCGDLLPPTSPVVQSPDNGETVVAEQGIDLKWLPATDTTSCGPGVVVCYEVSVDTVGGPPGPNTISVFVYGETWTTLSLTPGAYFWKVKAIDAMGNVGPNSSTAWFDVVSCPPLAPSQPQLLSPADGGTVDGSSGVVLNWVSGDDPANCGYAPIDHYRVQVSTDAQFAIVSDLMTLDSNPHLMTPPLAQGVYYWRVQALNTTGLWGPFSGSKSFTVQAP